jgi:hypothetical protein
MNPGKEFSGIRPRQPLRPINSNADWANEVLDPVKTKMMSRKDLIRRFFKMSDILCLEGC